MATYSRKALSSKQLSSQIPQKNKHGKNCQCGTSFDVAILIKNTGTSFDFRKLKTMIQHCINDRYDLRKKYYFLIIRSITSHLIKLIVNYGNVKIQ